MKSGDIKVRTRFMVLIIPFLFVSGILLIGASELAKDKWKDYAIIFNIINSVGASLFSGSLVTFIYNFFIKEIDLYEMRDSIKQLLSRDDKVHRIIFFAPTFLENEFYHEMLHQLIILAGNLASRMEIIAKIPSNLKHTEVKYHDNKHGYIHDLSKIESDNNTIIAIVPCRPEFHLTIPSDLPNLRNIVTLDMEVPSCFVDKFNEYSGFLANIRTDNEEACHEIAENLLNYFDDVKFKKVNIIICEGDFHNRGKLFKEAIESENEKRQMQVQIEYFPKDTPVMALNFGSALVQARHYVEKSMNLLIKDNAHNINPTFIFCSNDNMAVGARNALIKLENKASSNNQIYQVTNNTKIMSYDYSFTVRDFIRNSDKFIYFSSGQNIGAFAQKIIDIATNLENGKRCDPDKERKQLTIKPIFKSQTRST